MRLTCKVTTALGFFSTAYTRTRRCVSCAAARLARTSGPRPAPTTMITCHTAWARSAYHGEWNSHACSLLMRTPLSNPCQLVARLCRHVVITRDCGSGRLDVIDNHLSFAIPRLDQLIPLLASCFGTS